MRIPWGNDSPITRWPAAMAGMLSRLWNERCRPIFDRVGVTRSGSRQNASKDPASTETPSARATRRLQGHLKLKEVEAAIAVYRKARESVEGWLPSEREWRELVQGVINLGRHEDIIAVIQDYIKHSQKPDSRIRLKLAQILIRHRDRPAKALEVLAEIPPNSLPEALESTRADLVKRAEAMIADGVLEIDEDPR